MWVSCLLCLGALARKRIVGRDWGESPGHSSITLTLGIMPIHVNYAV